MRVKALQKMYYNRRDMMPGEEYEMDDRESGEVNILVALGKIELVKEEPKEQPKPAAPAYRTKQMTAADSENPPSEDPPPRTGPAQVMTTDNSGLMGPEKRTYRRRDMKAER